MGGGGWGLGCGVEGVGCGVWGVGCEVCGVGCGVWGVRCAVQGVGCGAGVSTCRCLGCGVRHADCGVQGVGLKKRAQRSWGTGGRSGLCVSGFEFRVWSFGCTGVPCS